MRRLGLFYYASPSCWGGQFEDDATASPAIQTQLLAKERKCGDAR